VKHPELGGVGVILSNRGFILIRSIRDACTTRLKATRLQRHKSGDRLPVQMFFGGN
jgi:hypothetical protein